MHCPGNTFLFPVYLISLHSSVLSVLLLAELCFPQIDMLKSQPPAPQMWLYLEIGSLKVIMLK